MIPTWTHRKESSPNVSTIEIDNRARNHLYGCVSTNDGVNWEYLVADHKPGMLGSTGWMPAKDLNDAKHAVEFIINVRGNDNDE